MASKVMRDINKDSPEDSGVKNTDLEQDASRSVVSFQSHAIEPTKKNIGAIALAALAFNICNSWAAIASTFAIAIASGGTFTLIYGILLISVVYLAVAITLAELASAYPTAGGQYHYTSIIAPGGLSRGLSYICGIAATCSWVFLAASIEIVAAQLVLAFPSYYVHDYHSREWHYFLISQLVNLVILMYNIFGLRRTPWVHKIGFILSLLTFVTVTITCLVRSSKQTGSFVWGNFQSNTGWPAGITFLTGLVTPAAMFIGLDGALHLAEECLEPEKTVPRALLSTIGIGFTTGFVFVVAMCYSIVDLKSLLITKMPIYDLWRQAIRSPGAATAFLVAQLIITLFAINAMVQTASRMTWAFARDGGIVGAKYLSQVQPSLGVPVWALVANAAVMFVLGCIYLGSVIAFNAIIGCSIILQIFSFALPALLLMIRGRSSLVLPKDRYFKVPEWLGWSANIITVAFAVIEIVFFNFPSTIPVTGSNMNYAAAVLVVTALFAAVNWQIFAKKRYAGPMIGAR